MAFLYTRAALQKTIKDIRKIETFLCVCSHILAIAAPLIAVLQKRPVLSVHIALLVLSIVFAVVTICTRKKENKKTTKKAKRTLQWIRRALRGINLAFIFYGFAISDGKTFDVSAVFSLFNAIAWSAELLLSLLIDAVEKRAEYFLQGFMEDVKDIPFLNNFVANGLNREFAYGDAKSREISELEQIIAEHKDEWDAKKLENKQKNVLRRKLRRKERTISLLRKFQRKNPKDN